MRHCEFGPQGEGMQGLLEGFGSGPKIWSICSLLNLH